MFQLCDSYPFTQDVTVTTPGGDSQTFQVQFQLVPSNEVEAILGGEIKDVWDWVHRQNALLSRAVAGWSGVVDGARQPVPFTAAMLERMLALPFVRQPLFDAYNRGAAGAVRGNSETPPAAGPAAA